MRSKRLALLTGLALLSTLLSLALPAFANESIKIGSLKAANVGPAFIAKEKGYFAAEGLDVDFTYFESAQPVAVGVAAGSLDFGCTSTSAGMYALAGQGGLKIISGMYSEAPGFHNFGIMASLKAAAAGMKSYTDLPGHTVAISQVGSPVHYSLALIAEKYHLDLKSMTIEPLQGIPQIVSAIQGNQIDAAVNTATAINPLLLQHQAVLLGWIGDETPWQAAITMTTAKSIAERPKTVAAFLRAFKRGAREYHDAFTGPGEQRQDGPNADEVLAILAKYTGQPPEQIKLSVAYVDGDARVDVKDIRHQIEWFQEQKMLKDDVDPDKVMDMHYVVPLPGR
ncbi:MAG TPA: ABC transporter substrate-binding protein [Stellaceae bacterium]|jgi:NitT/TauT family transport system substrate-binding protein|nr:ABC transporter substrate-binding protein [Stellaceae bacterium]